MVKQVDHQVGALISIVIATRTGATEYQGPVKLLDQFESTILNFNNVEVIIRGDYDDDGFDGLIQQIKNKKYSFRVDFVKGNRGRAYESLSHFYNECLMVTSVNKKIIFSLPEDVLVRIMYWDDMLLAEYASAREKLGHAAFTMHQSLGSGLCEFYDNAMEYPDSFPMYSADWLNAVGGFGYTTANDSWVQATHYFLLHDYGFDSRHFLPKFIFFRCAGSCDGIAHRRWANERLRNHDLMRNHRIKRMIKQQAETLYNLACSQLAEVQPQAPLLCETVNYACTHYSAAAVFFKVMYNFINQTPSNTLRNIPLQLTSLLTRLIRLKRIVPYTPVGYVLDADRYGPAHVDINNLESPLKTQLLSIPLHTPWLYNDPSSSVTEFPSFTKSELASSERDHYLYPERVLLQAPLIKVAIGFMRYKVEGVLRLSYRYIKSKLRPSKAFNQVGEEKHFALQVTPDVFADKSSIRILKIILRRVTNKLKRVIVRKRVLDS